jgi:hypothetical protein
MLVGSHCEYLWQVEAEDQAIERHSKTALGESIAEEQARWSEIKKIADPESVTEEMDSVADTIDWLINPEDPAAAKRGMSIPIDRCPYGAKQKLLIKASKWCEDTFGIPISTNKADECWDRYRRVVAYAKRREV